MTDIQGAAPMRMQCVPEPRARRRKASGEPPPELVDRLEGLLPRELLEEALDGLDREQITGPGGLLTQRAGRVIETALGAELSEHLGHPAGGVPAAGNVRNGSTPKTVQTELGPLRIRTPRDRDASFAPQLVGKRDAPGRSGRPRAGHVRGRDEHPRYRRASHRALWHRGRA